MIKGRIISTLKFLFFLLLGVFLIWITTRSMTSEEVSQVKNQILSAKILIIIPSLFIVMLSHFIRAVRWKMLITPLHHNPSVLNVFFSVLIGFFFNLIFPRLGEVMKCTLLGKHENIPVDKLLGTMFAERLIDVICLVIVISLTIITQFDVVGNYAHEIWFKFVQNISADMNKILVAILLLVVFIFILIWLLRRMASFKIVMKAKELLKGLIQGVSSIRHIKNKPLFLVYTVSIWML